MDAADCRADRFTARGPENRTFKYFSKSLKVRAHRRRELFSFERNTQRLDAPLDQLTQNIWIIDIFGNFVAAVDEIEVHPVGPARLERKALLFHHTLIQIGRRAGTLLRNCVIVAAVPHDGRFERADEFRPGFQRFLNGF